MTQSKPPKILHKKHIARAQREARLRRWVIGVSIGIVALIVAVMILLILIFGTMGVQPRFVYSGF